MYVGNLAYNVTEEDLTEAFSEFGNVESVNIIKDRFSGQSKGFGFVDMPDNSEADKAIKALNGKDLKGRDIKVGLGDKIYHVIFRERIPDDPDIAMPADDDTGRARITARDMSQQTFSIEHRRRLVQLQIQNHQTKGLFFQHLTDILIVRQDGHWISFILQRFF